MPQLLFSSPARTRIRVRMGRAALAAAAAVTIAAAMSIGLIPGLAAARAARRPIRVTMSAQNHHPVVKKKWTYSVTVRSATGQRLSGTETTHYLYNGVVVGTEKPMNVPFRNGYYHDTLEFPAAAVGHPLSVWVVVKTSQGSGSATWWISVVS